MLGQPGAGRHRLQEIIARFREKGATSPERAMTAMELGLPPQFEEATKRRLGASGIFVDVGAADILGGHAGWTPEVLPMVLGIPGVCGAARPQKGGKRRGVIVSGGSVLFGQTD